MGRCYQREKVVAEKVPIRLGKGWIHNAQTLYFYGTTREANDNDERWSIALRWANGEWGHWIIEHRVCGICTLQELGDRVVLTSAIDGTVEISDAKGDHETVVDITDDAPNDLRNITAMRVIGEDVFAIGMSRMVYRRPPGSLTWYRMDHGMRLRTGTSQIAGLRAIDGDRRGRFLAVGLFGEIWLFEKQRWWQLDSPTNIKLEAVKWVSPDLVFIAGASGTLLYGSPHKLKLIEDLGIRDTFWSIEWFQDKLYLATGKGAIYALDDDRLRRQDPAPGREITTSYLHAADGHLLSVGPRDALLFNGSVWRAMSPQDEGAEFPFDWTLV